MIDLVNSSFFIDIKGDEEKTNYLLEDLEDEPEDDTFFCIICEKSYEKGNKKFLVTKKDTFLLKHTLIKRRQRINYCKMLYRNLMIFIVI